MNAPEGSDFVRREHAIAFAPAEFLFTLQCASEMARDPGLFNRPAEYGFGIISDNGKVTRYSFSDIAENRFGFAVSQRYGDDRRKYYSFMWPWFALMDLIQSGKLDGRYYRRGEPDSELHEAVIELSAS